MQSCIQLDTEKCCAQFITKGKLMLEVPMTPKYSCKKHGEITETTFITLKQKQLTGTKCTFCVADLLDKLLPSVEEVK